MEIRDNKNHVAEIESNSKPMFLKRIIAFILDVGILFASFFGLYLIELKTPIAGNYNRLSEEIVLIEDQTKLDTGFGIMTYCEEGKNYNTFHIYTDSEGKEYVVTNVKDPSKEIVDAYKDSLKNNADYKDTRFAFNLHNYLLAMLGLGVAELIYFLVFPLCNKKRATIGQLVFGIALYSQRNYSYARWYHIMFRFLLVFIFESALPFLWLGLGGFLVVPVFDFIVCLINKNNVALRDLFTLTRLIEAASYEPLTDEQ